MLPGNGGQPGAQPKLWLRLRVFGFPSYPLLWLEEVTKRRVLIGGWRAKSPGVITHELTMRSETKLHCACLILCHYLKTKKIRIYVIYWSLFSITPWVDGWPSLQLLRHSLHSKKVWSLIPMWQSGFSAVSFSSLSMYSSLIHLSLLSHPRRLP